MGKAPRQKSRSTLEHYVRVRAKSRVPGGSLGRSFSRSCAGLIGPPLVVTRDPVNTESRRASLRGSLSRALGLTKNRAPPEKERDNKSTSSSENSSVISRVSPPLHYFRSSRSGGESPIYATPFGNHHATVYNRRSEEYESYLNRRSIEEYEEVTKSVQNMNDQIDAGGGVIGCHNVPAKSDKGKMFGAFVGGSLHRNKRQHRRVRSIGDIDVIHVDPV